MPIEIVEIKKEILNLFFAELLVFNFGIIERGYTNITINLQPQLYTIMVE